jgi:hypothetical protein
MALGFHLEHRIDDKRSGIDFCVGQMGEDGLDSSFLKAGQ